MDEDKYSLEIFAPINNFIMACACIIYFLTYILFKRVRIYTKDWIFKNTKTREMTEVEKWIYSKHKTFFCAGFLRLYIKKEIDKAIKKGNIIDCNNENYYLADLYKQSKIVYAIDEFDDIIILDASGSAGALSIEEQKNYVRNEINI